MKTLRSMSAAPGMFDLPEDIIFDILSTLPAKSLIQLINVCTSSSPVISHPYFTKLHLTSSAATNDHRIIIYYETTDYIHHLYSIRSPLTFQETLNFLPPYKSIHGYLQIVGSDTGLICLFDTNYRSNVGNVVLWNPSIKKFKFIDDPHVVHCRFSHFVMGFGFVSRTCEFKVVEIAYDLDDFKTKNFVSVYSLATNSWNIKEGVKAPCYLPRGWSGNVLVNGFVNWLDVKDVRKDLSRLNVIMAFDLDNERFQVLDLPKNIVSDCRQASIGSYGEESMYLSLYVRYVQDDDDEKWDVWVMGDYGVVDSWKKVFVVSQPSFSIRFPPLLMKNEQEALVVTGDGRLMLFDAIRNEMQFLGTQGLPHTFRVIRYHASLALLHG